MSEAFCRKIFKGVALAGAGVALGAAVFSFSLKRVSAASKKTEDAKAAEAAITTSTTSSTSASNSKNLSGSKLTSSKPPTPPTSSSPPSSGSFGSASSTSSLTSGVKSGLTRSGTSASGLGRKGRTASSTSSTTASGLSRNGSSSWDLHGSAASLVSSASEYDNEDADYFDGGGGANVVGSGGFNANGDNRPAKWNYNWDLRDPSFTNRARPKVTRHLFFILHGHYISNGETNLHFLSSLGKTQLELTGKRLVTLGLPFSRIYHSSALRCKQSVCILRGHLPSMETVEDDLLTECAAESVTSNHQHLRRHQRQGGTSGGSSTSFYEDGARIEAAFRKYIHRAELNQKNESYEVLVTHANVIRYFVCRALQLPPEAWLRMSLHNGSITWLSIRPDGLVFVRELGDTGHMPANDELKNPADGSLILTKMPSKMQSWYLSHEYSNAVPGARDNSSEDEYYGTVQL